ncbi:M24 family metallopeptidase [Pseudonocardia sp.]|uniref:M24 family metallopeptidase n=1 Tax=Pseudonocardia sp. TaxID=60912 RepID=UPI003D0969FC
MSPSAAPAARRDALRALLADPAELDALLVTDLVNVRYLTGFTGSNACLLVAADGRDVFCTDGRYTLQAAAEVPDLPAVIDRAGARTLVTTAAGRGLGRLGFESDAVTVDAHAVLVDELTRAGGPTALHRAPGFVQRLRQVKDADEIATLRRACAVADEAFAELVAAGGVRAGRTEREVALDLEARMRALGATAPAFESIVAAGANAAIPHHRPSRAPLCRGDLVTLDFGALVEGYHSDMTRTVVLGPAAAWQRELYELVAAAQVAGCAALRPGADVVVVDAAARDVVVAAGEGENFPHGLGHGVGLRIHEAPGLGPAGSGTLAAGMTVTVEPGVYLEGRGGVRIEDTLLVTGGAAEALSRTTRELREL